MRDTNRLKEKYELSLDNGQIVTLTIATLVVLGGVFALGVVVGKKLSAEQPPVQPAPDLLTAIDRKTEVLETAKAPDAAALTFQDELTKKLPVAAVAEPKAAEPKPAEPKPEPAKVAEVAKPIPPELKIPEEKPADPPKVADVFPKPATEKPKLPEAVKDTQKEDAIPTRTHDAGSLKEAFGKVQKATAAPEASANGTWTLQLSAYQEKAEADRFAAGLRDKGYAPFIVETNLAGKGTWYRVRMGRFASKDAASRYMSDFKRETQMPAFVTNQ